MKKFSALFTAAAVIAGSYLFLKYFFSFYLQLPIPASLMKIYMFLIVAGTLLALTADDDSARKLFAPFYSLLFDPSLRYSRNTIFFILPFLGAFITYQGRPKIEAPIEFRTVHPAPPSSMTAFGKTYNLLTLKNPYRELEKSDPKKFRQAVKEGKAVYYRNCLFCHGDKLRGKGIFTEAFHNPHPANFQDVGTIAQFQESYLFWRISTGGPGLPKESAPWQSPMPVWKKHLSENEIWKVILFLYDYTGHRPREVGGKG